MSQIELVWILKSLLLPPGGLILLLLLGLLLSARLIGKFLIFMTLVMLYLLSTPFAAQQLAGELEQQVAPIDTQAPEIRQAQAILVLGGGRYTNAPEYGSDTVGPMLLERLRFAARLSRETGLPIIRSGGSDPRKGQPEA
ncbi:MAG: YdcF family protein, partial [Chromatiales bacterium]|nr:YdcF family protein [Chromatiales bacterium]